MASADAGRVPPRVVQRVVLDYLVHHGHLNAASAFMNEAGCDGNMQPMAHDRNKEADPKQFAWSFDYMRVQFACAGLERLVNVFLRLWPVSIL